MDSCSRLLAGYSDIRSIVSFVCRDAVPMFSSDSLLRGIRVPEGMMKSPTLQKVFDRLSALYGAPKRARSGTALDELVLTVLSQNTNDRNSSEGFRRLKAAFPNWAAVEKAPARRVAAAIRVSGLSNIKSVRIQEILRRIREEHGGYSLEFLKNMDPATANDYLLSIPGVGPKTAACVLLFSFGKPIFPVDTHIHRVTQRLGIIGPKVNAEEAHRQLQAEVPAELVYPLHLLLIRHGRETCHARNPDCPHCVLLSICPTGKARTRGPTTGTSSSKSRTER
jgi:endonuclease III